MAGEALAADTAALQDLAEGTAMATPEELVVRIGLAASEAELLNAVMALDDILTGKNEMLFPLVEVLTERGDPATATYQIADVTRPLCAVSKMCDKGNIVVFQADGGYIQNPAGVQTSFRRQNNVYVLDFYVKEPMTQSGFMWQG